MSKNRVNTNLTSDTRQVISEIKSAADVPQKIQAGSQVRATGKVHKKRSQIEFADGVDKPTQKAERPKAQDAPPVGATLPLPSRLMQWFIWHVIAKFPWPADIGKNQATGLSRDFQRFLARDPELKKYDFVCRGILCGSFGGRAARGEKLTKLPVVFIHGDGDKASGVGGIDQTGWNKMVDTFRKEGGYDWKELYATTTDAYDLFDLDKGTSITEVMRARKFIEATLKYTGSPQCVIIAHSAGATVAAHAIIGGKYYDPALGKDYDIGPPLRDRVALFVPIAGAFRGLTNCFLFPFAKSSNLTNGFNPGLGVGDYVVGLSAQLERIRDTLREHPTALGSHVVPVGSVNDEMLGWGGLVNGKYTFIPSGHVDKPLVVAGVSHTGTKNDLCAEVLRIVQKMTKGLSPAGNET